MFTDNRTSCPGSGHHPFDYGDNTTETEPDQNEMDVTDLRSWEAKLSLSYVRNDRRVRRRIVDDDVEFSKDIWETLDDGMVAIRLSSSQFLSSFLRMQRY